MELLRQCVFFFKKKNYTASLIFKSKNSTGVVPIT